jgi:glycosyltransferase involved in cell wall biosynthesis
MTRSRCPEPTIGARVKLILYSRHLIRETKYKTEKNIFIRTTIFGTRGLFVSTFIKNFIPSIMTTIPSRSGLGPDSVSSTHPAMAEKSHPTHIFKKDHNPDPVVRKDLCTVLPAFNEELAIGSIVLRAKQFADRVIVVDDGSSDHTAEIARLAGADVIQFTHNSGKAFSVLSGLRRAHETGCTVAVMLDADGQHDPREILSIAELVTSGKADLVIGSRYLKKNQGIPVYRQVGQKILDFFTNLGANTQVTDSQSGFRALSCKALENLDFESDGYNLESDMIAHFSERGLSIMEVPISVNYNIPAKSKKHPFAQGVGVLTRLVNLIGYRRPLLAFGIPGFILSAAGMVAELWVFAQFYSNGVFHYVLAIGSAFILVLGLLLVIASLILNTLVLIMIEKRK